MNENGRKYRFSWDLVTPESDVDPRPSLGTKTSLESYRLFQFTLRDLLEQRYGTETADDIFRQAGAMAGRAFYDRYCRDVADIGGLANRIQERFKELSIGLVRFEKVDPELREVQLTVDEDLDCSGLPDTKEQICVYDEGLIQGILEAYTGASYTVREVDCWCTGERTCRFRARLDGTDDAG